VQLKSFTAVALVTVLAACTASSASTIQVAPAPTPGPNEVAIYEYKFIPAVMTIAPGTKITWINYDVAPHTATHKSFGDEPFDSGNLQVKQIFAHTFRKPGTYDYLCVLHQGMRGQVVVQ
jgi:plastocyanin